MALSKVEIRSPIPDNFNCPALENLEILHLTASQISGSNLLKIFSQTPKLKILYLYKRDILQISNHFNFAVFARILKGMSAGGAIIKILSSLLKAKLTSKDAIAAFTTSIKANPNLFPEGASAENRINIISKLLGKSFT